MLTLKVRLILISTSSGDLKSWPRRSRVEIGDLDELGMLLEQIFRGNPGSGEGFLAILDRRPAHIALHVSQPGATRARAGVDAFRASL